MKYMIRNSQKSKLEKLTLKFEYNNTWSEAKKDIKERITD